MVNFVAIIILAASIFGLGGGGFYILYLVTRPKKMTWPAKVYQPSQGIKPPIKDKRGNIVSDFQISDLRPFSTDVIERVNKGVGITVYRLVKLQKVVPAVTGDVIETFSDKDRYVNVLYDGDACTLLTSGYDRTSGSKIFRPLPHDAANMIKTEVALRTERLKAEKDVLAAITPWIIFGIAAVSMVALAYIMGSSFVDMTENIEDGMKYAADSQVEASKIYRDALAGKLRSEDVGEVVEVAPPTVTG